jgi:enoyl-CoA hydratase
MITGRPLTPREAKDLGLFDFLVPPDKLWAETREYAGRIAKGPARAIGFTKIALTEGVGAPLWTAFAWERELQNQLFEHPDCKEGVRAFFEKRPPRFGA